MKKILSLFLMIVMLLSVCSCDYPDAEPTDGKTDEPATSGAPELVGFGEVSETEYKNEYLGIRWTFGEGWMFYPESELRLISEIDADAEGEALKTALNEAASFADLAAIIYGESEMCAVGVSVENRVGRPISVSDYIDEVIEANKIFFATTGQGNIVMEEKKTAFLGEIYDSIVYTSDSLYQIDVIWGIGERIVTLRVSTPSEARAKGILAEFSAID